MKKVNKQCMETVSEEFPAVGGGGMSCSSLAEAEVLLLAEVHAAFPEGETGLGARSLWKCVHS